jgi:hypothetical protein
LIEKARKQAHNLISDDPELTKPEHQSLSKTLDKLWEDGQGDIS